jgi:hypothetical protein
MKFNKENCLQYIGKILKIKLEEWIWGNGTETPKDTEIIVKIDGVFEDSMIGTLVASDNLPTQIPNNGDAVVVKYPIINSIEIIDESDIILFVGYPNTYAALTEFLTKES